ncbi:MAG: ribonuclease P protein component [Planctomycetaceae bacterium]|nr:MAG: ribonuclease P protein component [Planctomycetaceae bacterium]
MDRTVRPRLPASTSGEFAVVDDRSESFPRSRRVRRGVDFTDIIRRGAFATDEVLVINVRRQTEVNVVASQPYIASERIDAADSGGRDWRLPASRLGITVPKKTGSAPVRNRWKRWIREAFRTQQSELPCGLDIIVRPKRDALGSFQEVSRSLAKNVRRAAARLEREQPGGRPAPRADGPPSGG